MSGIRRLRDTDLSETVFRLKLGLPVFLLSWFVLRYILARGDVSRGTFLFLLWIVAPLAAAGVSLLALFLVDRLARGMLNSVLATGGEAHSREYSEQEALVAAGRMADAVDSYQAHLVAFPDDQAARLRLAALLAGPAAQPAEAVRFYLEARRRGPSPQQETVIGNALIDLYHRTGQSAPWRAELARFARLHPGTLGGEGARRQLRELAAADHAALSKEQQ